MLLLELTIGFRDCSNEITHVRNLLQQGAPSDVISTIGETCTEASAGDDGTDPVTLTKDWYWNQIPDQVPMRCGHSIHGIVSPMLGQHGMSVERARNVAQDAALMLARDERVRLIYLYGSATDPERRTVRDVDLAVLTEPALSLWELLRARADVVQATGAPVDIVSLNDAGVALAHEVAETGRCLYANPPEVETEFVTRSRSRWWDFKPFRDEQRRLAGERAAERQRGPQT